jgi:GNAT superfamily N-acetyltransferase
MNGALTATGIPFKLRRVGRCDGDALIAMHGRCAPESRFHRWMGNTDGMPTAYLSEVLAGADDHHAVLAELCGSERRAIALGSVVKVADARYELGLLVEDDFQGIGVGTTLCDNMIAQLPQGCSLIAEALFENRRVLQRLSRYGPMWLDHCLGEVTAVVTVAFTRGLGSPSLSSAAVP